MQTRRLGTSAIEVSTVGLGCNNFGILDLESSRKVVTRALDLGITLLDTADVYGNRGGSEEQLGQILGPRRKDVVLATKFGMAMDDDAVKARGSRGYIAGAVEASLKRLRTDWIDLYQYHTPDGKTPLEETLAALDDLVASGKVRAIGCSNLPAAGVRDATAITRDRKLTPFVSAQDEYSLLVRDAEKELMPAIESCRMSLLPYFPLASGLLTGKYRRGEAAPKDTRFGRTSRFNDRYMSEANWAIVARLEEFCRARGRNLLELAFSWLLSHPVLASVIAGATRPEQVEANVKAASWQLTPQELAEIDRMTRK
ncbi:MAG: aldo/keto reductase [Alphaproteobacteria bacterium]|nr:aldo/keto reductase [Alphaproteobacteria bacterium]MBV9693821.1 aldo/keto reductase [Alphaproteobacteria bacterium]